MNLSPRINGPKALTALKMRNGLPPSLLAAAGQQDVWAMFHLFSTANAKEQFWSVQTIGDFSSYQLGPEERLMDYLSCCMWGLKSFIHPRVQQLEAHLCFAKINLLKLVRHMGNLPTASVLSLIANPFLLGLCFPHFWDTSLPFFLTFDDIFSELNLRVTLTLKSDNRIPQSLPNFKNKSLNWL